VTCRWTRGLQEAHTRSRLTDTAVTLALAAEGLGVAPVTDMMIGLNSSVPIIRIALVQEIVRKIVLIRPEGACARPTVRAVSEIVQEVISDNQ
jgi:DNA-binding transcriptional LysR family regulator